MTYLLPALLALCGLASAGVGAPQPKPTVLTIFERSCAECHGPKIPKPKGKFGFVLDLERLSRDPDFVVPGQPNASEIYRVLIDPDPEVQMPPPQSRADPLSTNEIETVRQWILSGAGTNGIASQEIPVSQPPKRGSFRRLFGHAHVVVIHFPIALIFAALLSEIAALFRREIFLTNTRWCLALGIAGGVASAATGWVNAGVEGFSDGTVQSHRFLGLVSLTVAMAAWLALSRAARDPSLPNCALARFTLLAAAIFIALAGHSGGILVHGTEYLQF